MPPLQGQQVGGSWAGSCLHCPVWARQDCSPSLSGHGGRPLSTGMTPHAVVKHARQTQPCWPLAPAPSPGPVAAGGWGWGVGGIPSHLPALFFHLLHTIYGAPTLPWALCKGSFTNLASANIQTFIFSSRTVFTLKITVLETPPPSPHWTLCTRE